MQGSNTIMDIWAFGSIDVPSWIDLVWQPKGVPVIFDSRVNITNRICGGEGGRKYGTENGESSCTFASPVTKVRLENQPPNFKTMSRDG